MRGGPRPNSGGKRPGAGRKKGIPNKASLARQKLVEQTGATPLVVMLADMRLHFGRATREQRKGRKGDTDLIASEMKAARDAAEKAAPYVHPRLASVAHSGPNGGPIQMVDLTKLSDEQLAALEPVLAALASESGEDQA